MSNPIAALSRIEGVLSRTAQDLNEARAHAQRNADLAKSQGLAVCKLTTRYQELVKKIRSLTLKDIKARRRAERREHAIASYRLSLVKARNQFAHWRRRAIVAENSLIEIGGGK